MSEELIEWLVLILMHAERSGERHRAVSLVVIVLLPKPEGWGKGSPHRLTVNAPAPFATNKMFGNSHTIRPIPSPNQPTNQPTDQPTNQPTTTTRGNNRIDN